MVIQTVTCKTQPRYIQHDHITSQLSYYKWLEYGQLFPKTEEFLLAIQDQVLAISIIIMQKIKIKL